MIPRGLGEQVLQALLIGAGNPLFHAFHVLSVRLHQTVEIVCGSRKYRPCRAAKVGSKSGLKPLESSRNTINSIDAPIR